MTPELELELFRFLVRLRSPLRGSRDADQALRSILRSTIPFLQADAGCIATMPPGADRARVVFRVPREVEFDLDALTGTLEGKWPRMPRDLLVAVITRRARPWGVIALRRKSGDFTEGFGRSLGRIAETASELVQHIDSERIREVRFRIDQKIMEELRGRDLFYQILHGLRSLTGYDHSSALLVPGEQRQHLIIEAEQIAWEKAKSERIGGRIPIERSLEPTLEYGAVYGFDRDSGGGPWKEWTGFEAEEIADLLDVEGQTARNDEAPEAGSVLCAVVAGREGLLGLLKIASRHKGSLGPYEADLVRRFLPHVSVAIQNSRRTETLQANLVAAERRSAMAELARSVAHDVNNALGAVLPLAQQIVADLQTDEPIHRDQLLEDLLQIEQSVVVCRRIFGGMLSFARGAAKHRGTGELDTAVQAAMTILRDGFSRRRIECEIDVERGIPPLRTDQSQLDQVVFNLLANARDAMIEGGKLTVRARRLGHHAELLVADTGEGIDEERLERIQEPFFTTKKQGTGLGLSIVRNIVWEARGDLRFESSPGEGTRVHVRLPLAIDPRSAPPPSPAAETETVTEIRNEPDEA